MAGEPTEEPSEAPEVQSIESIAAEYNLTQEQQTPKTEPQPTQSAPAQVPDPITDTDGFKRWTESQAQQNAELRTTLTQTMAQLNAEKQQIARQNEEKEINALVSDVATQLDGVPEKMVKYALADRYNKDAAFKAILDNRNKAPEAMKKAISALMPDLRKDFSIRADPQIAENQRAMSEGTRGTSATPAPTSQTAELLKMNSSQFMNEWERIKAGG